MDTIRGRLTLWHVCVLAILQAGFCLATYSWFVHTVQKSTDAILRTVMHDTNACLQRQVAPVDDIAIVAVNALQSITHTGSCIAIYDLQGRLLADKPAVRGSQLSPFPSGNSSVTPGRDLQFYTISRPTGDGIEENRPNSRRVAVQQVALPRYQTSYTIVVSSGLDGVLSMVESLKIFFSITVPVFLLLAGGAGWFLARKSLAPVVSMSERARQISVDNIEERLAVANPHDELGNLAKTFNDLLNRLSQALFKQRRFMADAAHELRTPISVIRTVAAVALDHKSGDEKEYHDALVVTNEQARHLSRTVEDVFHLARADDGDNHLQLVPLYLDELLTEAGHAATILGMKKQIAVEIGAMRECPFTGDEALLSRMVLNLLENSIKYTPAGGKVSLALNQRDGNYIISVTDTGIGIQPEAQQRIFDRFFREKPKNAHKSRHPEGSGLGLSIARWVAECHRGTLELRSSGKTGTCFIARLPAGGT